MDISSALPHKRRYYIAFSILFFMLWFLFKMGGNPHIGKALASTAIDVAVAIACLLTIVEWLLPRLVYQNRYGLFLAAFGLVTFIGGSVIILCQLKLHDSSLGDYQQKVLRSPDHYFYWFWSDLILGSYFLIFFVSSAGAAIRFAIDRVKNVSMIEKLENDKLSAELDSLRNQINPHFLFNALNTIYYKIEKSNNAARETLQLFAEMLRYQLYDCNQPFIPIEKELHFLRSYIELQKERMNEHDKVVYEGFDEVKGFNISPFLLMPLIENCFKHVASGGEENGVGNAIRITAKADEGYFYLLTVNTAVPGNGTSENGIGIQNIKRRLALVYPGRHELQLSLVANRFEVKLKIPQ